MSNYLISPKLISLIILKFTDLGKIRRAMKQKILGVASMLVATTLFTAHQTTVNAVPLKTVVESKYYLHNFVLIKFK